jgi:uncharacterized membrane protein
MYIGDPAGSIKNRFMEGEIQIMATLTVVKFPAADGANSALETLKSLQKQQLINIHDAAIVTWPEGKKKPKTKQLVGMAG